MRASVNKCMSDVYYNMTPVEERLNRDTGLELPGCWVASVRRQEGRTNRTRPSPTMDHSQTLVIISQPESLNREVGPLPDVYHALRG